MKIEKDLRLEELIIKTGRELKSMLKWGIVAAINLTVAMAALYFGSGDLLLLTTFGTVLIMSIVILKIKIVLAVISNILVILPCVKMYLLSLSGETVKGGMGCGMVTIETQRGPEEPEKPDGQEESKPRPDMN